MASCELTRRDLLASAAAATGMAAAAGSGRGATGRSAVVTVSGGLVAGHATAEPGVTAWRGIPYAAPPVGRLRWRAPQPVKSWHGVRDGARFSASPWASPHDPKSVYFTRRIAMDEDCLTLNVWAPGRPAKAPRPVFVWIYGGAFVEGSSDDALYDGAKMAADDCVFVSINYRLGILGFFAHPALVAESPDGVSGNYGLMDQIAALRWVRDNIAAFGGDPGNVTIAGQSAGAFSVGFHLVMPPSRGLFHRGIAQSGAPMGRPSSFILLGETAPMQAAGRDFAREVGATDLAALRAIPAPRLVAANSDAWRFYPAIDGKLIPDHPFRLIERRRHADVPMIVGFNHNEGAVFPPLGSGSVAGLKSGLDEVYGDQASTARTLFAAEDAASAVIKGREAFGDIVFDCNSSALAIAMARFGTSPVHFYHFAYQGAVPAKARYSEGTGQELGAFHGAEIGLALRTQGARGWPISAEQAAMTAMVSGYWLQFARGGNPNGDTRPMWPRYVPGTDTIFHLDGTRPAAGALPFRARIETLGRAMGNRIVEQG